MPFNHLEAVCRSEAQRILTCLRVDRKFADFSRGWRELGEDSPIRKVAEWRQDPRAAPSVFLNNLLELVRSPLFAGPLTHVALESVLAIVGVMCTEPGEELCRTLVSVTQAVCDCVFEETNAQTDEATTMQMIGVLEFCSVQDSMASCSAETRLQAFDKILALWTHYRFSVAVRAKAQRALQSILDSACTHMDFQSDFVRGILDQMLTELPDLPLDRSMLYIQCLERLVSHSNLRSSARRGGPHRFVVQDYVPLLLLGFGEHFGLHVSVLSLLLPIVNRICWLSAEHWESHADVHNCSLGALQIEALLDGVYLKVLTRAAVPLHDWRAELTFEEGTEILVVTMEALCDLLQPHFVRIFFQSFDLQWQRPALIEQLVDTIVNPFKDYQSAERPLPAYAVHLTTTLLTRILSAFDSNDAETVQATRVEMARLRDQSHRREVVIQLFADIEQSPKKAKKLAEACGALDFIPYHESFFERLPQERRLEWACKLAWAFRCLNYAIPYAATGEFFGQLSDDSSLACEAFVSTFNWAGANIEMALRGFLQAFLIPKEAQQIDRIMMIFAHGYYAQHIKDDSDSYLKHVDSAHTLAFSVILLNSDQYNPKVRRRMELKDFFRNNRGINDGGDLPEDVQTRIFESIRRQEIKTPNSGRLTDGISPTRWVDFVHLIDQGFRDNALASRHSSAHALWLVEKLGRRFRMALEAALSTDPGAHSDAASGLGMLLHLTLQQQCSEGDAVMAGLFFFGAEVFQESAPPRASLSLQVLCRTTIANLTGLSMKQLHMIVYLSINFAFQGMPESSLPPLAATTTRLLRLPSLEVEPPTGAVFSFLRKISAAPFRMLSFSEVDDPEQPVKSSSQELFEEEPEGEPTENGTSVEANAHQVESDISEIQGVPDPMRAQVEAVFEECQFGDLLRTWVSPWASGAGLGGETSRTFLGYVASLFLALRIAGVRHAKDQDVPWWPEEESRPEVVVAQALQLPKRTLALNIQDGYDTLRLAFRLVQCTVGQAGGEVPWDLCSMQEFAVCVHVGLFHTLRRTDLCERTLQMGIVSIFQIAPMLYKLNAPGRQVASTGWPVRLIELLVRRTANEPQLLVPVAKLCVESVRFFVTEACACEALNRLEIWQHLLLLLVKAMPTCSRALWSGTKDKDIELVQVHVWQRGIIWLLVHPGLLDCIAGLDDGGERDGDDQGQGGKMGSEELSPSVFWSHALHELTALAQEMTGGKVAESSHLLVEAHRTMLVQLLQSMDTEARDGQHMLAEAAKRLSSRGFAWSRVAIGLLANVGPQLARRPLIPILKQTLLNSRVPLGLGATNPDGARLILEKLVSVLTTTSSGVSLSVVRESVPLVAKFFLQNLLVLQKQEGFGQLWLMTLRLMLTFIKRGSDDRDVELEEIATETLKNILHVLLTAKLLGFANPRPAQDNGVPVWWQMTWDCIEVFMPGFGSEFSKSVVSPTELEVQAVATVEEAVSCVQDHAPLVAAGVDESANDEPTEVVASQVIESSGNSRGIDVNYVNGVAPSAIDHCGDESLGGDG